MFVLLLTAATPLLILLAHGVLRHRVTALLLRLYLAALGFLIGCCVLCQVNPAMALLVIIFLPLIPPFALPDLAQMGLYLLPLSAGLAGLAAIRLHRKRQVFAAGLLAAAVGLIAESFAQSWRINRAAEAIGADCIEQQLSLPRAIGKNLEWDPIYFQVHAHTMRGGQMYLWSYRSGQFEPVPDSSEAALPTACQP